MTLLYFFYLLFFFFSNTSNASESHYEIFCFKTEFVIEFGLFIKSNQLTCSVSCTELSFMLLSIFFQLRSLNYDSSVTVKSLSTLYNSSQYGYLNGNSLVTLKEQKCRVLNYSRDFLNA